MVRIVIRTDKETRVEWRHLANQIDDEADYEEVLDGIIEYFDEDETALKTVQRKVRGPEFR